MESGFLLLQSPLRNALVCHGFFALMSAPFVLLVSEFVVVILMAVVSPMVHLPVVLFLLFLVICEAAELACLLKVLNLSLLVNVEAVHLLRLLVNEAVLRLLIVNRVGFSLFLSDLVAAEVY